ncbi:ubiquitin carboxyl-terminal hydrolase 23 isoform X1 [Morus notabilis]|uniref:ubiquitin carboxyl-terminal hydrolase 23 isoform X1 n=1 Tax=Morus notabilis TaxID=981085 RepID=UPI000CED7F5D|nr:ubiquitin carboxyl-terminal hydrolase 23 isoform X1 [Morus notabilis]
MAESLVLLAEQKASSKGFSVADAMSGSSSLFQRRVEFHPARKPKGFSNGGDFHIETLNPGTRSDSGRAGFGAGQSGYGGKKVAGSEGSESGLDPELSFGITFRRIGAGLENLGNTCFLNSVLQCLTYTEPLAAYLQSGKHQNSCHVAGFCALCAIQKHVSRALQSTGRSLAPKDLVSNLRCISRNFRNARQEDAHEYMVNLLESMHKCCLPSGVPSESPSAYEKSLVHKIFGGSLRSQVKCLQCSFCSNKFDPFLDLSLEIIKADSLHKALLNFTAAELLDGGERQYQCQRCKQKVRARKQLTVHKAPYVLTIHLKRFRAHDPGQKIDKKVTFGPTLDLGPFVSDSHQAGDLKYTLYGVLVHYGWSTHSGHYYCYVRTSSGMWYSLDDSRVVQVSEKTVLEQKAYMLFYVRDRSNIASKKPLNVFQKESIKVNECGKNTSPYNQPLKRPVQNGSTEVKPNGVASSVSVAQKDASYVVPPRIPVSNGKLDQPKSEPSLTASLSKDSSENPPCPDKNPAQCFKPSGPPSNKDDARKLETGTETTAAASINDLQEKGSSTKKLCASVVTSPNLKEIQNSAPAENITDITSQEDSAEPIALPPEKIDSSKQPEQPNCEKIHVGSMTNGNATENSVDKASSCSQNSIKSPEPSTVANEFLHVEDFDCKSHKRLKKKILRRQVVSMNFRSSVFLRASLALQKKKKHKRSKHKTLNTKTRRKELLMASNCFPSEFGPSTSEMTQKISTSSTISQRKEAKSRVPATGTAQKDGVSSHGDSLKNVVDSEFKERIGQNGSILATDVQLHNHSGFSSSMNHLNARETGSPQDCKRKNGWMDVPTRGVEETVVARWDGIELPSATVKSHALKSVSIGYVPDEWDEEYDRGKRKKVRQAKHEFGGQNPFQAIATEKTKLKEAKMERSRSGNQPFRI